MGGGWAQFLAEILPDSDRSGAAMRAGPIGVFPTIAEVIARCELQAAIMHHTPDGIHSAVAALMTHYFLYDLVPKAQLGAFLDLHVPGNCILVGSLMRRGRSQGNGGYPHSLPKAKVAHRFVCKPPFLPAFHLLGGVGIPPNRERGERRPFCVP